jgi:hypothetical protein
LAQLLPHLGLSLFSARFKDVSILSRPGLIQRHSCLTLGFWNSNPQAIRINVLFSILSSFSLEESTVLAPCLLTSWWNAVFGRVAVRWQWWLWCWSKLSKTSEEKMRAVFHLSSSSLRLWKNTNTVGTKMIWHSF